MPQRTCQHCGQVFAASKEARGESTFCNLGCALRARVPLDEQGNFPVNQHLVAALVLGFLFFNQLMLAWLSVLVAHRGNLQNSIKLAWISFGLGVLVCGTTLLVQKIENVFRALDFVFAGAVSAVLAAAIWKTEPRVGLAGAAVGVFLIWNLRGVAFSQRFR